MKKAVTIRELARLAGISKTAAAMAMRNHPNISRETRARVHRLAEKHGYRCDNILSRLMTRVRAGRSSRALEKIAVIDWGTRKALEEPSPYHAEVCRGFVSRASARGYEVEFFRGKEPGMTGRRLGQILYTRGIRGVVLMSMTRPRGRVRLDWQHFAAATIGYTIVKPVLPRATPSHYQGMVLALRSLRHRGYHRVGFVNLIDAEDMVNELWIAAYLAYQFRISGKIAVPPLLLGAWDGRRFGCWLKKFKPDAVVSNWLDPLALLRSAGYRVPEDIGFASLDCAPGTLECAGVHQPRDLAAAMAIDLVVEQLEMNQLGIPANPKTTLVDGIWKDGPTIMRRRRLG